MRKWRLLSIFLVTTSLQAQQTYWKNKLPYTGYWQQDVAYQIEATLDETTDIITGSEQLTYTNQSPDTLYFVYFNLYQNAFQPGSYLHDLQLHNGEQPRYGRYEAKGLGTKIDSINTADGRALRTQIDNTVMKVFLKEPLYPGGKTIFRLRFRTFYDSGSTRRRMKKYRTSQGVHYNGCQWYPKICVYDRKSGWNADQHLNREFYGDYGTFDVTLNVASNYVLEATGVLQNEQEVLPDTLKAKLQISNFKNKKWDEPASVVIPYKKGERKVWRYHADAVHDFAFTADPTYRIADTFWNGIRCVAICQESHAAGWQTAAAYCAKIIRCFSTDFGMYEYPKMVVADAADGMEYPMLTLDGGRDPEYYSLLIHEVGHNWFYGMLGNNETYRAMLDEGFTQFITSWGMEHINGCYPVDSPSKNAYVRHFAEPAPIRDTRVYNGYLSDATLFNDEPLNTHSDMFNGALGQGGGYRHVYSKTATMLYNLQYVLGDSLFQRAMQHYVAQWKFCHPYPEDFRNSIIQFTHIDLNWFFDEWMETTKNIDYSIVGVKKIRASSDSTAQNDGYRIRLKRKGRMQMPIDLRIESKLDSVYDFQIPNTWFEKKEPFKNSCPSCTPAVQPPVTLKKWYGWDKLQPVYDAAVNIPGGIRQITIDPSGRLADINNFDNEWKRRPEFRFDSHLYPAMSWRKYRLWLRPDIWYNSFDGVKLGLELRGSYMYFKNAFSLKIWIPTRLGQGGFYPIATADQLRVSWFQYAFTFQTPLDRVMRRTTFYFQSRWLDGFELYKPGITKSFGNGLVLDIHLKAFTRNRNWYRNYLIHQDEWSTYWKSAQPFNSSLNLTLSYAYNKHGDAGQLVAKWRSATLFNSFNYHYLEVTHTNTLSFWRLDLRTRVYGRIGTGTSLPSESALFLAGGNPEDMMENKYMRAAGFTPSSWGGYGADINHLHFGGGLNLRGYAGYLAPEIDRYGKIVYAHKGNSGAAINAELDFNRIIRVKNARLREYFSVNSYLFFDGGILAYTNSKQQQEFSHFRLDAGAGVAVTIKKFFLQDIKPLTLRFDVPFFVSNTPYESPNPVKFRWVVGINRAF
ncbi:MAG: M1 family aminopeptidase [Chitinophagales bacterium]